MRFIALMSFASLLSADSSNPPTSTTGGFSEPNCTKCHTGALNPSTGRVTISPPTAYSPNTTSPIQVTINDAAENAYVLTTFANAAGSGRVWLGLNDAATEGTFVYTSGQPFTYANWDTGEPNNSGNEDYVAMYSGNGFWVDVKDLANPPGIGNVYGVVEKP